MDDLFHPAAEREFLRAVRRYRLQSLRAAAGFVDEVHGAVERLRSAPLAGVPYLLGTRRRILRHFPHSVVYVTRQGSPTVVAVAHHRRRPGYWARRLPAV